MPNPGDEHKFKRDVINSSELEYVQKMKYYYESQLDELSREVGDETQHGVVVTDNVLRMIEERLSDFEEKERMIIENCGEFIRSKAVSTY